MDYYTYGNADISKLMFDSIAMMTGANSSYSGLITVTALLGFIFVIGFVIWRQNFMYLGGWLFAIVFFWYGFFTPKVNVVIVDQTNPTIVRTASNVPLGIAFMGNVTSSVGKWFTDISDKVFTPINDVTYSNSGLVFGANNYRELRSISLQKIDPILQSDISQFLNNCTTYDISLYNSFTLDQMMKSNDLLSLISNTKPAFSTPIYDATSKTYTAVPCPTAITSIKTRVNNISNSNSFKAAFSQKVKGWYAAGSSATDATGITNTMNQLKASYDRIFTGVTQNAVGIISQEAMVNAVKFAALQNAQVSGDQQQMAAAIASAQAEASLLTQENSAALIAAKYLPIAHNVIEAIVISIFPIVLVMAFLAGIEGFKAMLQYAGLIFSIKLWPGLFAMVNGIAGMFMITNFKGTSGGASSTTLSNSLDMLNIANSTQSFAGWMVMFVPAIAFGLLKLGQGGLSSAFSQPSSAPAKTGESTGTPVGSGSVNVGNSAWDTTRAHYNQEPGVAYTQAFTGTSTKNLETGQSYFNSSLPVSANTSLSNAAAYSAKAAESKQLASSYESQMQQASSAVQSNTWGFISSQGSSYIKDLMNSSSSSAGDRASYNQVKEIAKNVAQENGISNSSITDDALTLGLSVGVGTKGTAQDKENAAMSAVKQSLQTTGVNGKVNEGVSHRTMQSISTAVKQGLSTAEKSGISFSSDVSNQVTSSQSYRNALNSGNQYAVGLQASQQQLTSASIGHRQALTDASNYEQAASQEKRKASQVSVDYGVVAAQVLKDNPSMSLDNPQDLQKFGAMVSNSMGISEPGVNAQSLGGRVQNTLLNGASTVAGLYHTGTSEVSSASSRSKNAVQGSAGNLLGQNVGSGFDSFGQNVRNTINQTGQKVETGDYSIAQDSSNIYAKAAAISPTDTQKAMNLDGSSFGIGNQNSPMDMSDKLSEQSKNITTLGNFNYSGDSIDPKYTEDPARTKDTLVVGPQKEKELRRLPRRR